MGTKRPYPIPPRYRSVLSKATDLFVACLCNTLVSEAPRRFGSNQQNYRLANRILFIVEVQRHFKHERLQTLIAGVIPSLKERADRGEEATHELARLVNRVRGTPLVQELKEVFLHSLNNFAGFERFLYFQFHYGDLITEDDIEFVKSRFEAMFPGRDLSIIDAMQDYDHILDYEHQIDDTLDWDREYQKKPKPLPRDPNQSIHDLFDSLRQ